MNHGQTLSILTLEDVIKVIDSSKQCPNMQKNLCVWICRGGGGEGINSSLVYD
jgi:hypothetical protein